MLRIKEMPPTPTKGLTVTISTVQWKENLFKSPEMYLYGKLFITYLSNYRPYNSDKLIKLESCK